VRRLRIYLIVEYSLKWKQWRDDDFSCHAAADPPVYIFMDYVLSKTRLARSSHRVLRWCLTLV
jgi:hypothetical protein